MTIAVDRRQIKARQVPGIDERLTRRIGELRDLQFAIARDLAEVDETCHFAFSGCASVVEYATRHGFGIAEARRLTNLGKTLSAAPEAEARIRGGGISIDSAAIVGRILGCPTMLRDGDDWLASAAREPMRVLRRLVRERFELHAQGDGDLEEVSVFVCERTRDEFMRAREVASLEAGEPLTEGQTFARVVRFYLEKRDPLCRLGAARRVGDTRSMPESRYIPAAVRRAVHVRSGGGCEVPGCQHRLVGLQFAHRSPHALGSGREVDDIGLLCGRHHTLYDAGRLPWPVPAALDDAGSEDGQVRERAPPIGASGASAAPGSSRESRLWSLAKSRCRNPRARTMRGCRMVPRAKD